MIEALNPQFKNYFETGCTTELRAQENRSRGVTLLKGNVVRNNRVDTMGVCARVRKNNLCGFSSKADISDESVRAVLKAATENADFLNRRLKPAAMQLPKMPNSLENHAYDIHDPAQKAYIDFLRSVDDYLVKHCPKLTSRAIIGRADSMNKTLLTSDASDGTSMIERSYIYVNMTAEGKDGNPVELTKVFGGLGTFDRNFTDVTKLYEDIDDYYQKLLQKTEGVLPEAGEQLVVFSGGLTGMIAHEAVGHTVEADLVLGGSVAGHCLNKQVASEKVTLVDFANEALGEKAPLPVYIDDEGVVAKDVTLIDKGILVGYMNNRESAEYYHMPALGNARAFDFSDEPLIRMRNTAVLPGTDTLEDMIASVDHGYYLMETNNGQADTTGEFMFGTCLGYEINHGKLGRAILDTTISGVAFEMLKTVDMVGNKMEWLSSGMCGKKQPMPVGLGGPAIRCKITMGGR